MRRPTRRTWRRLGTAALLLAALVVALELVLRALEPGPFTFHDRDPYVTDPVLRHAHRPGFRGNWEGTWFEINALGYRGPAPPATKAPDELRVVCLGDSCTFGRSVTEAESWPRQLEGLLAAELAGRRPVVVNLGINGLDGREYREVFLRHGAALAPDLVVIGYNLNDFPNPINAVNQKVYNQRGLRTLMPKGLRDGLGRTALYRWARAFYYEWRKQSDWERAERVARKTAAAGLDEGVWREQEELLGDIVARARALGAHVAVCLFPYESQVYLDSYDTTAVDRTRELCARLDVPFVDLAERFRQAVAAGGKDGEPPRLFVYGDRYHPSAAGYRVVAEAVLEQVRERGWLESTAAGD